MAEEKTEEKKKSSSRTKPFLIAVIILLILITAGSLYAYYTAQQKITFLSTTGGQEQLAKQQLDSLVTKVKKHMMLPANETPTIATVTDVNSLKKSQPFFEGAQNGDQVLVYVGAKKAIIYSPSRDLIVNVGFVGLDSEGIAQAQSAAQVPLTVEVRNGTKVSGLGQKVAEQLKNDGYTVQKITDAKKKDYSTTQVIDLGKAENKDTITALAQSLDAAVSSEVPADESASSSEVVVIIGSDKALQ